MSTTHQDVDLLILGAGWTSTFLIPLCILRGVTYTATSRPSHRNPDTVPFEFDENDPQPDPGQFAALPGARTVLITFPIKARGASERLVKLYEQTHEGRGVKVGFVQLGSTGIWDGGPTLQQHRGEACWIDRHSEYDKANARAAAEDELLALSSESPTTVLNLCGLWGGPRAVKHVVGRVAPTKAALKAKTSLHMIHGEDVARAILAVHTKFHRAAGERWLLTDGRVYDWWDLAAAWGDEHTKGNGYHKEDVGTRSDAARSDEAKGPQPRWVRELMNEEGVRALPRPPEVLGRVLDSRDFWNTFELEPVVARLE